MDSTSPMPPGENSPPLAPDVTGVPQTSTGRPILVARGAVLLVVLLAFRLVVFWPTAGPGDVQTYFRIGTIPWSDARGWADGAEQTMSGERLSGFAAHRALYPLHLATLFTMVGMDYTRVIYLQMVLFALAVAAAYLLLGAVRERVAVVAFLALIAVWRPILQTHFMTENLSVLCLVGAFALTWRGMALGTTPSLMTGVFLLGLSQAVRPYAVLCVLTVPFLVVSEPVAPRARWRLGLCLLASSLAAYLLHAVASLCFNAPGSASNYAYTLYGQVTDGIGVASAYGDPILWSSLGSASSEQEQVAFVYARALDQFLAEPLLLLRGIAHTLLGFFRDLDQPFLCKARYFVWPLLALLACEGLGLVRSVASSVRARPWLLLLAVLFAVSYEGFWLALAAVALIDALRCPRHRRSAFVLCYAAGILLSLPFVGLDGGDRVRVSSDIFIYLLGALGLGRLVEGRVAEPLPPLAPPTVQSCRGPVMSWLAAAVLLLGLPAGILLQARAGGTRAPAPAPTRQDVSRALGLHEVPIAPDEIRALERQWPGPALEAADGRMAYLQYRYTPRDAVFLMPEQGAPMLPDFWPLSPLTPPVARTVFTRQWTVFPKTSPEDLARFDGRVVVVVGTLRTKLRAGRFDSGWALVARYIGEADAAGPLTWYEVAPRR